MKHLSDLYGIIKNKAISIVNRKKRTLEKIKSAGLENYIKSKIEYYSGSPALVAHFKNELHDLKEKTH